MDDDNILEDYKNASRAIQSVRVGSEELSLDYKNGDTENYFFKDLKRVSIITTDEGPMLDDVFWLMLFEEVIIMIPQGIPGENGLLERLQELPGFNNEAVIKAMQSTENNAFEVWELEGV